MATNKNAYLRYRIINSCFTNKYKRYWTITEVIENLAEHDLFVEKRTLEQDFELMRYDERLNYHAPIAYCRTNKGYHYTDVHYSIDAVPLTAQDLETLTVATNILQQYKGAKLVAQFEGVVDKLSKVVAHLKKPEQQNILAFEESPYYKGHDHFDTIYQAIAGKQPVHITYRKFTSEQDDVHILHPYFLKEYRGRWYVLGYSEARHYTLTLALDRIINLKEALVTFKENKVLKPKEYFQHTIGITLGKGPVQEIELWFSSTLAPYIKTQHLHHTQKTLHDNVEGLVIALKLIPNPELLQLLLSYCGDVKVIKPESLKNKFVEMVERGREIEKIADAMENRIL